MAEEKRKIPQKLLTIILLASLLGLFLLEIAFGPVQISISSILKTFSNPSGNESDNVIIWYSRLPQALIALLSGIGLALSGWLMQSLFRNPLASPSVLGISSGASLGVALAILSGSFIGISSSTFIGDIGIAASAMIGAILVLLLVIAVAARMRDQVSLLIVGIMIGHFVSAIVSILQFKSNPEALRSYVLWGMGSFADADYNKILVTTFIIACTLAITYFLRNTLNVLSLGDDYAQSLGVSVKKIRIILILISGVLAGVITAFCGPIAFIGLAVPHFTRIIFKSSDHRQLFFPLILIGAITGLGCDFLSRMIEIPLNAVTSAIGAPVVIFIIVKNAKTKAYL
ncbi:MAG: iron ABC transporter permease [Flavobacteriales bacterium]